MQRTDHISKVDQVQLHRRAYADFVAGRYIVQIEVPAFNPNG